MNPLPPCIHRGKEVEADQYVCRTDRLLHGGVVPGYICRYKCHVSNVPLLQSQGFGDTIHKATHAIGMDKIVGDCGGCRRRLNALNKLIPYGTAPSEYPLTDAVCEGGNSPVNGPIVRNLMMYIYPISQFQVWRWNVVEILRRIGQFNGTRSVAIMTDQFSDAAETVQSAFGDERIDHWIIGRNNPARWEMQALPQLQSSCFSCDPNAITFYCHAKGVQGPEHIDGPTFHQQPRVKWAKAMYESCLDYPALVEKALERSVFAGSFKRRLLHQGGERSSWHYSGTFYWTRNVKLFSNPKWHLWDKSWFGAETYPGQIVGWYNAAGLFCDHPPVLYVKEGWDVVDPLWEEWKREHEADYVPPRAA